MRCICGAELQPGETLCGRCQALESQVQVLTPEERRGFQGVTIDQNQDDAETYQTHQSQTESRVYVKHFTLNSKTGFFTKLLIGAVIAAILVFIAMPLFLLILVVGLIWLILNSLR